MNEKKELKEATKGAVTPPPFRQHEEPQVAPEQESGSSPTLADRIAAMNLDEPVTTQLTQLTAGMDNDALSPDLLATLARGITHDTDVQNADATGYLRGRNEKIEAVLQPAEEEDSPQATPVFPRYCRRSIWD